MRIANILLILMFLIPIAQAVSVEQDDVIISSQDNYHCQNVISDDGCLFTTSITVQNNRVSQINAILEFDTSTDVVLRDFRNDGLSIAAQRSKGKNIHSQQPFAIGSGVTEVYDVDFYASQTGKFNFSVFFSGIRVTLDPIYNVSINSSPSTHLKHGLVSTYSDTQFLIQDDITNGLTDSSDVTSYDTSRAFIPAAQQVFDSHDMVGDSNTADINVNGEGFLTNITWGSLNNIQSIEFCFLSNTISGTPKPNISIAYNVTNGEYPIRLDGFDTAIGTDTWQCDSIASDHFHYFEDNEFLVIGLTCDNCDASNKLKIRRDDDGTAGVFHIDDSATPSWSEDLTRSLMINVSITTAEQEINGTAIKLNFPINFSTDNEYYLSLRKVTGGVANVSVHLYSDNTSIDPLLITRSVTTGWDSFSIPIIDNRTARMRVFASSENNFSEAFLIESINDTAAPVINSVSVNDSQIFCGGSVRLLANVTDDTLLDTVFFRYEDFSGVSYVEADRIIDTDLFFIDLSYSQYGNDTYNWTVVNATDVVASSTVTDPALSFVYTCIAPVNDSAPIITLNDFVNGSVVDRRFFNQTINFTCNDDQLVYNMSYSVENTTVVASGSILGNLSEHTLVQTVDISSFAVGDYTVSYSCYDNNSQSDSKFKIGTVVSIANPYIVTANETSHSVFPSESYDLTVNNDAAGTCGLFVNGSLFTSKAVVAGNTDYAVSGLSNGTYAYYFECSYTVFSANTTFHTFSVSLKHDIEDAYSLLVCPINTLPSALMFMFFVVLAIAIILIDAVVLQRGIFGTLASFMLFGLSFYMFACLWVVGFIMSAMSLLLISYFIFNAFR